MLRSIDHIVILVRDLAQAAADYERLGFTVTPGGEHTGGATHNALIAFADGSYFELIAFKEPEREQPHRWWPRLAKGEGLVDYCLASDGLAADAEAIRGRGLELQGPADAGRVRPDGQRIAWRSITSGRPVGESALPFAIEDVTPRELRVPGGAATEHRLGVRRVAGVTLVVRDLQATTEAMRSLLGVEPRAVSPSIEGGAGAMLFGLGDHWLEVIQPEPGGTGVSRQLPVGDESALRQQLETRGEGPYEVVLSGETVAAPGSGELLPLDQTHGARIRVAR